MATRVTVQQDRNDGMAVWTVEGLLEVASVLDVSTPFTPADVEGLCVQAIGNFDTNAVVTIQGSNDGVTYFTIGSGTLTASNLFRTIAERPLFIRGAVTTVGAGDATDVDLIFCGSRRRR